ncbi:alpha/beta hydrolase family protein [Bifidobacterium tibiigranuli]|uniref:Alpha/beta fold hydrolase n=1 Tax=Bifidobacterium tibiigranuli TaxID=2172043 RepID=A0A5N6S1L3_9BIFI|nr:alpha/beta fold hydrolase [Bifidobacterium tibiigranuli]KAE8128369.1 alpha/beta fold hydrolase [Bifidobacterium tibiigranuli]KAE8128616.1 dipeptidyl aminopeptidase [Bifidobacterium tibiigranuli]
MGGRNEVLRRQSQRTKFNNTDMDFAFNLALGVSQIVGMNPGEVLAAVATVKDGDPRSWRESFYREARFLSRRADSCVQSGKLEQAGQRAFGAAYARRFALGFASPNTKAWNIIIHEMEQEFMRGAALSHVPIRPIEVPFESSSLPGYYLEIDGAPRPTLLVVGGGDTFREDLFYYGGYPGWRHGYNVLMVDLPGQGKTPDRGFTFRHDSSTSIAACLDWLEANASAPDARIALFGLSGGGYFTAQAASTDSRVAAWIASTPITDIGKVFSSEMGGVQKAPGWLTNMAAAIIGRTNSALQVSLEKYAWQFGTKDFAEVLARAPREAPIVDASSITCPSLFMFGAGEAKELARQTQALAAAMKARHQDVTVRKFEHAEGDAHCQVTNLKLAHQVIFDWLDRRFCTVSTASPESAPQREPTH